MYRDKYREKMKSVSTSSSLQKQIKVREKGGKGGMEHELCREDKIKVRERPTEFRERERGYSHVVL